VAEEAPWAPPFTPIATPSAHPKHLAAFVVVDLPSKTAVRPLRLLLLLIYQVKQQSGPY
jgi:hypothetical protein